MSEYQQDVKAQGHMQWKGSCLGDQSLLISLFDCLDSFPSFPGTYPLTSGQQGLQALVRLHAFPGLTRCFIPKLILLSMCCVGCAAFKVGQGKEKGQKEALPPYGIKNSEDLVTFLKPKIKSYDVDMVKEVYQHYVKLNNDGSGLEALEKISATDWLLQWGEGYIELRTSTPKKFWTAWRIFAAFNVKAKGDVAPFPADFLEHLPKDIFDNEFKGGGILPLSCFLGCFFSLSAPLTATAFLNIHHLKHHANCMQVAQSRKKQQALFTIHMSSLLSFQGAYFEKEWDEKAVMKKLQSVLSHDPWALMMGHSTFTFK
eukprot:1158189-Pelagomonas_calceolata.AAC.3